MLVATIVAVGIKEVGTLPSRSGSDSSCSRRRFHSTLSGYSLMSAIFGLMSAASGVILSIYVNVPAGPLVVIVGTVIFAGSVAINSLSKRLKAKRVSAA